MKKSSVRNVIFDNSHKHVNKEKEVKIHLKNTQYYDEYSDPSDLDFSMDFEPDIAYGDDIIDDKNDQEEQKSALEEFKPFIISNLIETEADFMPIDSENSIKHKNMFILTSWIMEIHKEFNFSDDTLISSVDLLNRVAKSRKIRHCFYQLFAATSLWIASKLEETQTPALSDFVYLCNNKYKENEFIECEKAFLSSLGFNMYGPTARSFILAITSHEEYEKIRKVAEFFLSIALLADDYSVTEPSVVAISCIYLAILATSSSFKCFDEIEELRGIDSSDVCAFSISILATHYKIFQKGSEELKNIFLEKISKLPVSLPEFNRKFIRRINEYDLVSLQL